MADEHTGAMIALLPDSDSADFLALGDEGAELVGDLHLTLLYLGDGEAIESDERAALVAWGREYAAAWEAVEGEAFAAALVNPVGDEPCVALILNSPEIAEVHADVQAGCADLVAWPEQHEPFIPHITLAYVGQAEASVAVPEQFASVAQRVGPVRFDRLRFAFAGEVTDIPLGMPVQSDTAPEPDAEPESDAGATPELDELPVDDVATAAGGFCAPSPTLFEYDLREPSDGCIRCGSPEAHLPGEICIMRMAGEPR